MIDGIAANTAFKLADLIEFEEGGVARKILAENDGMRLAVLALDEGAILPEHAAPGDVIVFVLEGEAHIDCGDAVHAVAAGGNFMFAKGELHEVSAPAGKVKMALVVKLV